jgi:hypothetical protein
MTFAMPDVEAHGDVWSLMQHAATSGSNKLFEASRVRLVELLRTVVHPLLASTVPVDWVEADRTASTFKIGAEVHTPYGQGAVVACHEDSGVISVSLPSGTCFVAKRNVYPAKKSSPPPYAISSERKDPVLLLSNNKL